MITFLKKLFQKEVAVDLEKISDQAKFSFEGCRLDKQLLTLAMGRGLVDDDYQAYLKAVLPLSATEAIAVNTEVTHLLEFVKQYKSLLGDSFFYKIDVDVRSLEEGKGMGIYPFVLFPLVRNALYLGYNTVEKYPVRIRVKLIGEKLKLEVSNRVNHHLENQESNADLRWFKSRLEVYYADKYTLLFNSNSNLFKATLLLDLDALNSLK